MAEPAEPKTCMRKELRELVVLAVPSTAAFFLTKSQSFVSVLFVGHLGERQLAAASLATTLANVTGNSIMIGLSSGLATLCGQAYGAGSLQALGEWLQRALVMLILVVVPVSGLWLWIEPLLRLIGQEPDIAAMAGRYMALLVPGLWFYGISMALQFFLQAQRLVRPPMYTAMMSACLHPLFNYLLIFPCGMGYRGAAAAYSLSQGLQLAVMLLILRVSDLVTSTWRGWYWRTALSQWWPFLKLALPSLVLISEWWASEITIMLSGLLPDPHLQLSVMSIYQNTNALVFMLPVGIASAAATRVANELGAARPAAASAAARAALLLTASVVLLAGLGILAARHTWALLFVRGEPELIALTARTLLVLSAYVVFDGLQSVLGGVIKGAGRQASGAPVVVGSYYLAGLPAAAVLGFQLQLGVVGLCLGMLIGTALHCLCYLLVVLRIRWSEEARRAAARIAAKPAASGQLPVAVAVSTDRSMEGSTGQVVLQPLVLEMRESTTSSGMLQATAPSCPEELPLAPFTVPSHSLADDSVTDGGDSDGEAGDVEDESTALLL